MVWIAYALTGALLVTGALLPTGRSWGLEAAAWAPLPLALALLAALVALPLGMRRGRGLEGVGEGKFLVGLLGVSAAGFVLLRAHSSFLGDGTQLQGLLAQALPPPKATSAGTWFILLGLRHLAPGVPDTAARIAYQAFSVGSGLLFVLAAWFLSGPLMPTPGARRRLVLLLVAGGWSLQFFGYFENYALFLTATTAFALAGAHAALTRRRRAVPLVLAFLACGLHAVGIALLPAAALLFVPASWSRRRLLVAGTILAAAVAAVALRLASQRLEMRLLFVPPVATRFSIPGYTWFSPAHLLDLANLAILLVPGLLVLAVVHRRRHGAAPRPVANPAHRFLAALAASTWTCVFVLDPKLGMPRDWDLLAFAGPPLLLALALPVLDGTRPRREGETAATLAIALAVLALIPRAVRNADEAAAYRQFRRHLALDHARGRNARYHATAYLQRIGEKDLAAAESVAWMKEYPERQLVRRAILTRNAGSLDESIRLNLEALRIAPDFFDSWNDLGTCYKNAGRYTEARDAYDVAMALNPGYPGVWINVGLLEWEQNRRDEAVKWWLRAANRDPRQTLALVALARAAAAQGDPDGYARWMARAAESRDVTGEILDEWAAWLANHGRAEEAAAYRTRAREAEREAAAAQAAQHAQAEELARLAGADSLAAPAEPTP